MSRLIAPLLVLATLSSGASAGSSAPPATSFAYQGSLRDAGFPANGLYDLTCSLWDADIFGNQVGTTLVLNGTSVTDGVFNTQLDFGAGVWDGGAKWLEISINGQTVYPRLSLGASPYSLSTRGVEVDANGNVGIGASPSAFRLAVGGSLHADGPVAINHAAPTEQLDVEGSVMARSSLLAGYPFTFFRANASTNFVGIGDTATGPVTGADLLRISDTANNSFVGMYADSGPTGRPFYGYARSGSAVAYHSMLGDEWQLNNGGLQLIVRPTSPEVEVKGDLDADGTISAAQLAVGGSGISFEVGSSALYGVSILRNGTGGFALEVEGLGTSNAARFDGNVSVVGNLAKSSGTFLIDHPLDPENLYLRHSFVESPDMMNVYNGNAVTDEHGEAHVQLPGYFDALNRDFRYQLTVIGTFAQAIIAEEVEDNRFTIRTDKPNVKVSWQVTGVRDDAYARAHPIRVEEEKSSEDKGRYLHPAEFGHTPDKRIGSGPRRDTSDH